MRVTTAHEGKHLTEQFLLQERNTCPFCGNKKLKRVFQLQENPDVFLLKCFECFAVSASRMPSQEALDSYYAGYYETNDKKVTMGNTGKFAYHIFKNTLPHLKDKKELDILDYGGGNGDISLNIANNFIIAGKNNVSITVIDYNSETKTSEDSRIKIKYYNKLSLVKDQKFDMVIASAIIEHIPNPMVDLNFLFNCMHENAVFYARTPYLLPLLRLFKILSMKLDFTYPGHVHDLGSDFWNNVLNIIQRKSRFSILKSKPSFVEASFKENFFIALAAYLFKAPWYIIGDKYGLVGGWEIFIKSNEK